MERFFNTLRKTLVATIVLVFGFVVTYTPQPYTQIKQAEAAWPTFETNPVLVGANVTTAAETTVTAVKEIALDQVGFLLAKTMLSQMLQSMVTWINSGFKGSPAFIQDLEKFLLDVADETAGEFIKGLGDIGSFICSPFRLDIQLALSLKYQKARERRNVDSCTLSGVVDNIENFFNNQVDRKDFWKQWIEVTSKPQTYTPYGQFMAADAELNARIVNARGQEIQLANWSDGFIPNKICEIIEGPTSKGKRCVISTPGKVISEQINKALGAGQDQLVAADEINEVISALLGQIANQALSGAAGLLGLSVGTGYTAGGYGAGSYVDELVRESYSSTGSFLGDSYSQTVEKLEVQQDLNDLSREYIPKLQIVKDNPRTPTELKDRATQAYQEAIEIQAETTKHIAFLTPILNDFVKLQKEYELPATTNERKREIITEQTKIILKATQYRAYTVDALRISAREWKDITGL